ncbi:TetR/AcrR family transcriptional regulator C-terminal domain-containing protein [Zhihengliuella halotolerans]|uniref:TetR family transcriptional regulator n=1 Tax=Zhihengliuella halotolerans TaxID=370736 RepID=A0A4Q8AFP7_9MICC|nr:TetR/AcrR family transcriptional regulator C-terminal domain-containing protein [Zhihengliuella halotolerans]RZU63064.1 TetR family transcriptional regulator [Zhihengliuella halotolerans]
MPLNRRALVAAAMDLLDEKGAEALTMRNLASRVDRKVASLYNHVSGRPELVELIRAEIVASIDTEPFAKDPWNVALERWARSYGAAFGAHPASIRLLATTPIRDASTYVMYERVVDGLARGGWPAGEAVAVMRTVEAFVLGAALDMIAPADLLTPDAPATDLPAIRRALAPEHATTSSAAAAFELGLTALLDGLTERLARLCEDRACSAGG